MARIFFTSLALLLVLPLIGQQADDVIKLVNPSFEDTPGCCRPPDGWTDCGKALETPPDIQPANPPIFAVTKVANHGLTYLGLVVRDNDTWESISQRLEKPILKGKCYTFSLSLCRSATYVSGTKRDINKNLSFTEPVIIRIWGGNDYCQKRELLSETKPVDNVDWKKYSFRFEPKSNVQYIMIEAFYKTPTLFPYNGNILVDNASVIQAVPCAQSDIPVAVVTKSKPKVTEKPVGKPIATAPTKPKNPILLKGLDVSKMKAGQIIPLDRLYFEMDSFNITLKSRPVLDELFEFLNLNQGIVVEIGGHTNNIPPDEYCDKLSTARAKSVTDYLLEKGIDADRLQYKGYGKRRPIASNISLEGRKRNQRVEIKILQIET